MMNDTFTSILVCVVAIVLIVSVYAFVWLLKRGNHDELFPIAILCLGLPPLGILILLLTFLDRYQKEKMQAG
jgi:maltodextrin utilization protein YvdJ